MSAGGECRVWPLLRPSPVSGQPGERSGRVKDRRSRPRSGAAGVLDAAAQRPTLTPRGWGGSRTRWAGNQRSHHGR